MQEQFKTHIKEIFTSIQGEGPYIGEKHIFVRFCKCNLSCKYCDTNFDINNSKEYSILDLYNNLKINNTKIISFTGGEPLLEVDFLNEFLKNYKEKLNKTIYLETNGTLYNNLKKIIDYIDIISMDIKLNSATKETNKFKENKEFLKISSKKKVFIKAVFDENIKKEEIDSLIDIAKENNNLIILQPKMPMNKNFDFEKIYNNFYSKYQNVRLIPQVHKFLSIQ